MTQIRHVIKINNAGHFVIAISKNCNVCIRYEDLPAERRTFARTVRKEGTENLVLNINFRITNFRVDSLSS